MKIRILQFLGSGVAYDGVSIGTIAARMGIKRFVAQTIMDDLLCDHCVEWYPYSGYRITDEGLKIAGIVRAPYDGSVVA